MNNSEFVSGKSQLMGEGVNSSRGDVGASIYQSSESAMKGSVVLKENRVKKETKERKKMEKKIWVKSDKTQQISGKLCLKSRKFQIISVEIARNSAENATRNKEIF